MSDIYEEAWKEYPSIIENLRSSLGDDEGVDISREDIYVLLRIICMLDYEDGHAEAEILENFPEMKEQN